MFSNLKTRYNCSLECHMFYFVRLDQKNLLCGNQRSGSFTMRKGSSPLIWFLKPTPKTRLQFFFVMLCKTQIWYFSRIPSRTVGFHFGLATQGGRAFRETVQVSLSRKAVVVPSRTFFRKWRSSPVALSQPVDAKATRPGRRRRARPWTVSCRDIASYCSS